MSPQTGAVPAVARTSSEVRAAFFHIQISCARLARKSHQRLFGKIPDSSEEGVFAG